jgi:hypothetical protein
MVVDTAGRAIRGAEVVVDRGVAVASNAGGQFRLDSLRPGRHRLSVRAIGYAPLTRLLALVAGTTDARITLSSSPYRLPELAVKARSRRLEDVGFYKRRAEHRLGRFIEGDSLVRLDSLDLMLALSGLRGVHMKNLAVRDSAVASNACRKGFQLWVNGWEIDTLDRSFYFRTINPNEVEGVEIYEEGTPPLVFTGTLGQSCLIAVWER